MPVLKITCNITVTNPDKLLRESSEFVSELLAKSETFVMVHLHENQNLIFGGTDAPCAFVELKSIELNREDTNKYSEAICSYLNNALNISPDRIYIDFSDVERDMFGWNNKNFVR